MSTVSLFRSLIFLKVLFSQFVDFTYSFIYLFLSIFFVCYFKYFNFPQLKLFFIAGVYRNIIKLSYFLLSCDLAILSSFGTLFIDSLGFSI